MKNNKMKYLICVNFKKIIESNDTLLREKIKSYFNVWYDLFSSNSHTIYLCSSPTKIDRVKLRDEIQSIVPCELFIMEIGTTGGICACGTYAEERNWKWLTGFCDNDFSDKITEIPNVGIRNSSKEDNIGI